MNTGYDIGCAVSPIGYNEEYDEKIALALSPPRTVLQQMSKSADDINIKANKKKKKKRPKRQRMKKSKTNKFMQTIKVGQTVKLTQGRMAYVRFKGKVKFSIGIWYGVEIYDLFTNTRHNGTVFGKKYFNCPRNKGLFVQREVIVSLIKPENIKKMLKNLERKQLQKQRQASPVSNKLGVNNNSKEEQEIRKSFKRFQRLSTIMQKVPSFKKRERKFSDLNEESENEENEFFEVIKSNDDTREYEIKFLHSFEKYIEKFECVDGSGLLIKELSVSNYGRALLLEFGVQGNSKWFVHAIAGNNLQTMSRENVNNLLDSIDVDEGYSVILKRK